MTTTLTAFTPEELELESVELLPTRETLCCYSRHSGTFQSVSSWGLVNVSGNNILNINLGGAQNNNTGNQAG